MALAGQLSVQRPHLVHSGIRSECGSSFSGHASTHARQSTPLDRRHAAASTRGFSNGALAPTSDSSAPSGHSVWHHRRKTTNSSTRIAGNTSRDQVGACSANARHTATSVANIKPTGHTRQNTGNPNTAVETNAPASTPCRASIRSPSRFPPTGFNAQELAHPEHRAEAFVPPVWSARSLRSSCRPSPRASAPGRKKRCTGGTGHTHEQNARPNSAARTSITARTTNVRGTASLVAASVSKAPSGHSDATDPNPNDDNVPHPACSANPNTTDSATARHTKPRTRLRGNRFPLPSRTASPSLRHFDCPFTCAVEHAQHVHGARVHAGTASVASLFDNVRSPCVVELQRLEIARIAACLARACIRQARLRIYPRDPDRVPFGVERPQCAGRAHLLAQPAKIAIASMEIELRRTCDQKSLLGGDRYHATAWADAAAAIAFYAQAPQQSLVLTSGRAQERAIVIESPRETAERECARKRARSRYRAAPRDRSAHPCSSPRLQRSAAVPRPRRAAVRPSERNHAS